MTENAGDRLDESKGEASAHAEADRSDALAVDVRASDAWTLPRAARASSTVAKLGNVSAKALVIDHVQLTVSFLIGTSNET